MKSYCLKIKQGAISLNTDVCSVVFWTAAIFFWFSLFLGGDLSLAYGRKHEKRGISLKQLAYSKGDIDFKSPREVSYYAPSEEIIITPDFKRDYLEIVLIDDQRGVLKKIRQEAHKWRMEKDYRESWNADERTFPDTRSPSSKKKYLGKNMLRYVKERVWDEAEEREPVRKVVNPKNKVELNQSYAVDFSANLLKGYFGGELKNPILNQLELQLQFYRRLDLWRESSREKSVKLVAREYVGTNYYLSNLEYVVDHENWKWKARRSCNEIAPGLFVEFRVEQGALDSSDKQFSQTAKFGYFLAF